MIPFLSSFIFITNIFTTFYKKYYLYSFYFLCLLMSSLIYHYNSYNIYINLLDKIFIFAVVLFGFKYFIIKINYNLLSCAIIISFLLTIYLFIYGYYTKQYCFNNDICIGNNYHCLIHLISSIGHHLIAFL